MSLSPPISALHCVFLGHTLRHKTNVLSSVTYDESLRLCQLTSSYSIPLPVLLSPSLAHLPSCFLPPSSSALLPAHSFIHSLSLLNFGRGMCSEESCRQTDGRGGNNLIRLPHTHSIFSGKCSAVTACCTVTEQEVDSGEGVRVG